MASLRSSILSFDFRGFSRGKHRRARSEADDASSEGEDATEGPPVNAPVDEAKDTEDIKQKQPGKQAGEATSLSDGVPETADDVLTDESDIEDGQRRKLPPLAPGLDIYAFREVFEGFSIVERISRASCRQNPHDRTMARAKAVGVSGLSSCVGVYFKPDPDFFFLAHIKILKWWDFSYGRAGEDSAVKLRERVFSKLERQIGREIPGWQRDSKARQLMKKTLVVFSPWTRPKDDSEETHEIGWQLHDTFKRFVSEDEDQTPERLAEWHAKAWTWRGYDKNRFHGFVLRKPDKDDRMPLRMSNAFDGFMGVDKRLYTQTARDGSDCPRKAPPSLLYKGSRTEVRYGQLSRWVDEELLDGILFQSISTRSLQGAESKGLDFSYDRAGARKDPVNSKDNHEQSQATPP